MLDQPSKHTEKSTPGWRFLKLLGYGEAPSAGPSKGTTGSRTTLTADQFPAIRPVTQQPETVG
jgi:hypothetical protein